MATIVSSDNEEPTMAEERMILIIVRLGGVEWDAKLEESKGREDETINRYQKKMDVELIMI